MYARSNVVFFAVVLCVLCLPLTLAVPWAVAQTTVSILEGKITDSTGAVLPGATVAVEGTTVTRTIVTDPNGLYRALALPAGTYTVTVNKAGFETKVLRQVTLVLDQSVELNLAMEVASHKESVNVTAEVPLMHVTDRKSTRLNSSHLG